MSSVDELIAALPAVGLKLTHLGWHAGGDPWGATIRDIARGDDGTFWGQGTTPTGAIAAALQMAGVSVDG